MHLITCVAALGVGAALASCSNESFVEPDATPFAAGTLNGSSVVPSVSTASTGNAAFSRAIGVSYMNFTVDLTSVNGITGMHLHVGAVGANDTVATPLVNLYAPPFTGAPAPNINGRFMDSNFGQSELRDHIGFDSLARLVAAGRVYIDVHTMSSPDGYVRGQLGAPK